MNRTRVVNLAAVAADLSRLDGLASEHPELLGESSRGNVEGWMEALREVEMAALKLTAFRLPEALLKRLDEYADRVTAETGNPTTRADVVRILLGRALDANDTSTDRPKRSTSRAPRR